MIEKKRSILIVGGTGVISYAVVLEALKQGISVTCINRGQSHAQRLPDDVELIKVDYHRRTVVENKLKGRHFNTILDVLCFREEDIDYSLSLFGDKCDQYMFFSSCAVYNKGRGDYTCNEDSPLVNPIWEYSINKVKCETALKRVAFEKRIVYTIIRPAVTYGNTRIPYGISPKYGYHGTLIWRILSHKPIILWDNGEVYSTITRVEDFAIGLVGLIGNEKAYNETFNITGDECYQWKDVVDLLGKILGVKPIYFNVSKEILSKEISARKGEILGGRGISQFVDNSKLKNVVKDFKTNIPLYEGLQMTVNYYKENNYLYGIAYSFDGDWDRIIKKYSKKGEFKVGFVDYLGNASRHDKWEYYSSYHKDRLDIKSLVLSINLVLRIIRYLKKRYAYIRAR